MKIELIELFIVIFYIITAHLSYAHLQLKVT